MRENLKIILGSIQFQPQRQDSLESQLRDLAPFADRLGLRDAADFLRLGDEKPLPIEADNPTA